MVVGLGGLEMGHLIILMIIIPVPFILTAIMNIYYYNQYANTKNIFIRILQFSVLIFIIAFFSGGGYKNTEWKNIQSYLEKAGNTVEEYRTGNNIDILSEDDFKNIHLPENITVGIYDDGSGYYLLYKYGIYRYAYEYGTGVVWLRKG